MYRCFLYLLENRSCEVEFIVSRNILAIFAENFGPVIDF